MTPSQSDESSFFDDSCIICEVCNIQILLKFQPSISYNGGVMLE